MLSGCSEFPNYHIRIQFLIFKNMFDMLADIRLTRLVNLY